MREILFRGKRVDNGKWIEGFYLPIGERTYIICEAELDCTDGENTDLYATEWYEVITETVCQYTGLVDKKCRRFEGDIFQASDGDYIQQYVITWNEDTLEWSAECMGDPDGTLPLSEFRVGEIDVIGNIFDNHELLKGESDEQGITNIV